jgi:FHA domain containing protein
LFTVPDEEVGSTVLLTDIKIKSTGRFLRTVNGKEDIELSYLPFIIGKQERVCDYVLDTDGVSRMHLKFFEKDNELYARDLNSRNGTYVNGRKLENEENIRLYNGDSINICGISYILEI